MKTIFNRIAVLMMAAALAGCASGANPIAMVPTVVTPASKVSALSGRIGATKVIGGEETSPLWTSEISNSDFKLALDQALTRGGYKTSDGTLTVFADLIEVEQPLFGASITVTTEVRYRIVNQADQTLFEQTIRTPHTTAFSEAVLGVQRLKLANEGSARANLAAFLDAISRS